MKDTVKRIQKQATDWENIFPNHISDKEFVSRLCKVHSKVNNEKQVSQQQQQQTGKSFELFVKEDIHMVNKHVKRPSMLLVFRERQIKTTMR